MRLRSLKYASSFFSKNENDVNLAVASTVLGQVFPWQSHGRICDQLHVFEVIRPTRD